MYKRLLDLASMLEKRSYFLLGPRGSGKSTLFREKLPNARVFDLLESTTFQRLLRQPEIIGQESTAEEIIVIDEIQKLPSLLDEVHRLIQKRNQKFLLTGSSARKLKRGGANLLAGRAFQAELLPLTSQEIPDFDLLKYLNTTGLPEFYAHPLADDFLEAYVGTYLKEEIQAESLTRNLPGFAKFLEVVALSNGEEINYANISNDSGVQARTLQGYFEILTDTFLGFHVEAFNKTKKRKAISRAKYYLFDIGVVRFLCSRGQIEPKSELFGKAFEHFIALELRAWKAYQRKKEKLCYWRTTSQFKVDFVLGDYLAIEVKATDHIHNKHLKGLKALREEGLVEKFIVVSLDPHYRKIDESIEVYPWQLFLEKLWNGSIL